MNLRTFNFLVIMAFLVALAGCGGPPSPPVTVTIGAAGDTVAGLSGAKVVIPARALAKDTPIGIAQTNAGAPALPAGTTTFGATFAFTPHGTTFAVPVTITVPFDPAKVLAGTTPVLLKTNAANGWDVVAGATVSGNLMTAQVTGFSFAAVANPPGLERGAPERTWNVISLLPTGADLEHKVDSGSKQKGGVLDKSYDFGTAAFRDPSDPKDEPDRANGRIFSSASGGTYSVFGEAPSKRGLQDPIGNTLFLQQQQGFIKKADNAKLQLVLSKVRLEAIDNTNKSDLDPCTTSATDPNGDLCDRGMSAQVSFDVTVFTGADVSSERIFYGHSNASLHGWKGHWQLEPATPDNVNDGTDQLWSDDQFTKDNDVGDKQFSHAKLELKDKLTIPINLSRVKTNKDPNHVKADEQFTLGVVVSTYAQNSRGGETYLGAYLKDPQQIDGGVQIITEGLEPTNPSPSGVPATNPNLPPNCAPLPSAGTLGFLTSDYTTGEAVGAAGAELLVTRTGGSAGEVNATVTTGDATATAGTDYQPVNTIVTFKDGDTTPREVRVPLIYSSSAEPTKSFNVTLSKPTGCGSLGLDKTVVTILDDTRPLPTPSVSGLDLSFGLGGKVFTNKFGGSRSAMALQPDGKIVMVGGGFTNFQMAHYNPDGTLDMGFGSGGKLSVEFGSFADVAESVALQPDGKIVLGGFSKGVSSTGYALTRIVP